MFKGETVYAVIPARGGSKRFPGKNLFPLDGKPMIAWTLEAARGSMHVDVIHVSTDSPEIADACRAEGVPVEHLRPSILAEDQTPTVDVVRAVLGGIRCTGWVVLLQPTSPLRIGKDIDAAFDVLLSARGERLVSVSRVKKINPNWLHSESEHGTLERLLPEVDHREIVVPNGAIYIARCEDVLAAYDFSASGAIPFFMPETSAIDVDTVEDMATAARLLTYRRLEKGRSS
jgi:CMP-N,N'-diacetyllegionaminic acid synthase